MLDMLYTLCYFENDFCLKFVRGEQLRPDLRNRSSKIELLSIGKKRRFSFAPFHGFKNDFRCPPIVPLQKKQLKKKERKTAMRTPRLMSSVREKAGLLKLLLCFAFLFFGLLKQVKIAVESKTIGVIFPPVFRFSDFILRLGYVGNAHES